MLHEIIEYIKNPIYEKDPNKGFKYRLFTLLRYVGLAILASLCLVLIPVLIEIIFNLELGKHAMDDLFDDYSTLVFFFLVAFAAPFIEEPFFRGPIVWFKDSTYFKWVFYISAVLFGYLHISNFELSLTVVVLSPLLVAPQISLGLFLGMIRVKFNLWWSIAFHAVYNAVLVTPLIILKLLDINLE